MATNRQQKRAAAEPQVGIFWVYKGDIIQFSVPVDPSQGIGGGFVDSPYDHVNMWDRVVSTYPELRGKGYESIPRGRVSLTPNGFNLLATSRIAANPILVRQIMRRFALPPAKTKVMQDTHYENPAAVANEFEDDDAEEMTPTDRKVAKLLGRTKF